MAFERLQNIAAIGMCLGGSGVGEHGLVEELERLRAAPALSQHHPEQMQRVEMLSIGRQNGPIEALGLIKLSGLVKAHGLPQHLCHADSLRHRSGLSEHPVSL